MDMCDVLYRFWDVCEYVFRRVSTMLVLCPVHLVKTQNLTSAIEYCHRLNTMAICLIGVLLYEMLVNQQTVIVLFNDR